MSCHDARELFSARADDALTAPERAALDAHLASCAECRRESERFRATIALLHAVEHPRAPVGFVDRVLGATSRVPRHRRVLRALFLPWRQKLPMEAAAVVLVGVMAVILFKATPELQQAARVEPPTEAPRREARPVTPVPVAPSAPPREEPPAIVAEAERDATRQRDLAKSAPAPIRARSVPAEVRGAPADAAAPAPAREAARESAKLSALRPTAADLSGHLVVKDRDAAARALAELATRAGGREITRRATADATVMELVIPRAAWAEFARGLARLGTWSPEREPAELPAEIRVALRIIE